MTVDALGTCRGQFALLQGLELHCGWNSAVDQSELRYHGGGGRDLGSRAWLGGNDGWGCRESG